MHLHVRRNPTLLQHAISGDWWSVEELHHHHILTNHHLPKRDRAHPFNVGRIGTNAGHRKFRFPKEGAVKIVKIQFGCTGWKRFEFAQLLIQGAPVSDGFARRNVKQVSPVVANRVAQGRACPMHGSPGGVRTPFHQWDNPSQ